MFQEWSDPYDIDNYYGDVEDAFKDIKAAPSGNDYITRRSVSPPSPPAPVTTQATPATAAQPSATPSVPSPLKSPFEVVPDSIFTDGHPVGHQPKFNILRSKEGFTDDPCGMVVEWTYILIAAFCMFVLLILYIQARSHACNLQMTLQMMMMLYNRETQKNN
jgi:hypothetical protein